MTSDDIIRVYADSEDLITTVVDVNSSTLSKDAVELFLHEGQMYLIAGTSDDDDVFPAIGPLKSFDHAWSILTMRGYTVVEGE